MHERQPDMTGKTCLVTGPTSGIGRETALGLARRGATVVLVARDQQRGEGVLREVRAASPAAASELFVADLASLAQVRRLAAEVRDGHARLDVLVNNAGAAHGTRRVTVDGLEATFAGNYLGPWLLTNLLYDQLAAGDAARIVNVASDTHRWVRRIRWDDLPAAHRYRTMEAYNLSKLCVVLWTTELARRLAGTRVTANCLHPGWPIKTALDRDARGPFALFARMSKAFGSSAADGALTSLYLATAPELVAVSGRYFAAGKPAAPSRLAQDGAAAARLWALSERLTASDRMPAVGDPRHAPRGGLVGHAPVERDQGRDPGNQQVAGSPMQSTSYESGSSWVHQ
jgi:retinol dehydrogenase 12